MTLFPKINAPSGLLLLDKPSGPTSHDIVAWARRVFKTKRVGHCGTLDPMATGLMLLCFGEALPWQNLFTSERKTYSGKFRLGFSTDTDDITGTSIGPGSRAVESLTEAEIREAIAPFVGPQEQRVPRFSAVKVKGYRLYEWARRGVEIDLPRKSIEVYRFDLVSYAAPDIEFFVDCSKGTYIRSLARDLGGKLGTGATLLSLCRESIGDYSRAQAYAMKWDAAVDMDLMMKCFIPLEKLGLRP